MPLYVQPLPCPGNFSMPSCGAKQAGPFKVYEAFIGVPTDVLFCSLGLQPHGWCQLVSMFCCVRLAYSPMDGVSWNQCFVLFVWPTAPWMVSAGVNVLFCSLGLQPHGWCQLVSMFCFVRLAYSPMDGVVSWCQCFVVFAWPTAPWMVSAGVNVLLCSLGLQPHGWCQLVSMYCCVRLAYSPMDGVSWNQCFVVLALPTAPWMVSAGINVLLCSLGLQPHGWCQLVSMICCARLVYSPMDGVSLYQWFVVLAWSTAPWMVSACINGLLCSLGLQPHGWCQLVSMVCYFRLAYSPMDGVSLYQWFVVLAWSTAPWMVSACINGLLCSLGLQPHGWCQLVSMVCCARLVYSPMDGVSLYQWFVVLAWSTAPWMVSACINGLLLSLGLQPHGWCQLVSMVCCARLVYSPMDGVS